MMFVFFTTKLCNVIVRMYVKNSFTVHQKLVTLVSLQTYFVSNTNKCILKTKVL